MAISRARLASLSQKSKTRLMPRSNHVFVSEFFELIGKFKLPMPASFCRIGSFSGVIASEATGMG